MSSGSTPIYSFPYPLSTDSVRIASDIEELATAIDSDLQEIVEDRSAAMWTGGTFSNGLTTPTYNDSTGKMSMSLTQDIQTTASPQFVNLTLTGDVDIQGGDVITNQTTFNIVNTTATTVNLGGSATTVNIGNSSGQVNFAGDVNLAAGKIYEINNVAILDETTLGSSVIFSSLTSVGIISSGQWQGTTIATAYGGTGLTSFTANRAIYSTSTSELTSGILPLEAGGTNSSLSAISGGVAYSTSTGIGLTAAGNSGQVLTSNGSSAPTWEDPATAPTITLSGDATGSGTDSITVTLADSGVVAGTYGSSSSIPTFTVDSKGRLTDVVEVDVDPMPSILMMAGM